MVEDVCGTRWGTEQPLLSAEDIAQLVEYIKKMQFVPGGRYLYYAGRPAKFLNNCFLLRGEEDTREEWANLAWKAMQCLTTGGGIGVDYSRFRASGQPLVRTGGTASGPLPLMHAIDSIGTAVMQGGSRRSAIYASLNWKHEDIPLFLTAKNWSKEVRQIKEKDFNFPAPLSMTNISLNYDDDWLNQTFPFGISAANQPGGMVLVDTFLQNVRQAMKTGEPKLTIWAFVE